MYKSLNNSGRKDITDIMAQFEESFMERQVSLVYRDDVKDTEAKAIRLNHDELVTLIKRALNNGTVSKSEIWDK